MQSAFSLSYSLGLKPSSASEAVATAVRYSSQPRRLKVVYSSGKIHSFIENRVLGTKKVFFLSNYSLFHLREAEARGHLLLRAETKRRRLVVLLTRLSVGDFFVVTPF